MVKSLKNKFEESLTSEFPNTKFIVDSFDLVGEIAIISALFENELELKDNWEFLSSSVCSHFQMSIEDDFTRWNTYLIYVCKEQVKKELKYQIENDKFSNRKIVIEIGKKTFNSEYTNKVISEKIILDELKIQANKPQEKLLKFEANDSIEGAINSIVEDDTNVIENILKKIETHLKDENFES